MFVRRYTDLQLGGLSPIAFRRAEATKQVYALDYDNSIQLPADMFSTSAGAMDIDPSERYLLTGHQDGQWSIVDCWTIDKTEGIASFEMVKDGRSNEKPRYSLSSVFWHIDSGMFSTCSWFGTLKVYDTNRTRKPMCSFGEPTFAEFVKHTVSSAKQTIMAASNRTNRTVSVIDLRIGCEIQVIATLLNSFAAALRFSTTSEHLLSVGTELGQVLEWDLRSPFNYLNCYENKNLSVVRLSKTIPSAHRHNVSSLKYSEDGHYLYTYGVDKTLHKFSTANANLEETVVLDYVAPRLQHLEIYVFENTEDPIVMIPYTNYLHLVNMKEGVAKVVAKIKCPQTVHGFTFNQTITKGFSYGKACNVFAPRQARNNLDGSGLQGNSEHSNRQVALIDISDL